MKRILSILAALLLIPATATYAQKKDLETNQVEKLLESYAEVEGVMQMSLKGLMLNMAKSAMKDSPARHMMNNMKRMTIFSMNECSKTDKARFEAELKPLLKDYMMITEVKEDDSVTVIYIDQMADNGFKEMVMHMLGPETGVIVLRGNFTHETLEKIVAEEEAPEEKKKK